LVERFADAGIYAFLDGSGNTYESASAEPIKICTKPTSSTDSQESHEVVELATLDRMD
jgi:hypothetical protein